MQRVNIKKELEALLYDCSKMTEPQAVEVCLNKFKSILKLNNAGYYNMSYGSKKKYTPRPILEEESVTISYGGSKDDY